MATCLVHLALPPVLCLLTVCVLLLMLPQLGFGICFRTLPCRCLCHVVVGTCLRTILSYALFLDSSASAFLLQLSLIRERWQFYLRPLDLLSVLSSIVGSSAPGCAWLLACHVVASSPAPVLLFGS